MRTRVIGSALIVFVGLIPTLTGGPLFALLLICLGVAGYHEYLGLAARVNSVGLGSFALVGYVVIAGFGLAALFDQTRSAAIVIAALAVAMPLVLLFPGPARVGAYAAWSLASTGSLYLGIPVYAAIAIRSFPGTVDASWLTDLAGRLSLGWDPTPRGMGWALTVVLVTWIGDSVAYLTGRSLGKRPLTRHLSPNKTVEGAVAGLLGSMAAGAVCLSSFGLGAWWLGVASGGVIGLAGLTGDLGESFLKRQAGVKDSGTLIPGHGGVLDRIDGLFFAFPAGLVLTSGFERFGIS